MRMFGAKTNWGAVSALIAMVAIAGFHFIVPVPSVDPKNNRPIEELESERTAKSAQHDQASSSVKALTWQVGRDEIGPKAMAWVSKVAQANFVSVSAFRPQRTVEADGLDQLNYMVTAEGQFLNVMRLISAFESEGSLLAVKSVQLASTSGATDTVRATIGLVAYQEAETNGS